MFAAFVRSWGGWLLLAPLLIREIPSHRLSVSAKRAFLFPLAWLAFGLLNALHWVGFLLDEVFFSRYRQLEITRPIAIVGVPRSGTTFLQRALATEPRFTTLTLLECVLAPSISERYLWFGLRRVIERIWPGRQFRIDSMEAIHPIGLDEPEEDFLLLLWIHACFLLAVLFPDSERFWRLARFDMKVPDAMRREVFEFYRRCLQKHLYYHGPGKTLLSKNPSFTPMLGTLREHFPEAAIVGCVRPPEMTVPSQLSSLLPAFGIVGDGSVPAAFSTAMIGALRDYYEDLARFAEQDEIFIVEMSRLNSELEAVVTEIFDMAGHAPSETFQSKLSALGSGGRNYESTHRYSAGEFGLTDETIRDIFSPVWPLSLAATEDRKHT